jgi:aspartate 1-decarboxylase
MKRMMLKAKIHMAEVTSTQVNYEGSLALDRALMDAADLIPYEKVAIADVANGARFETYLIEAPAGSGTVIVNGAAARLVKRGDPVIIFAYADMDDAAARKHTPIKVFPKDGNKRFEIES